MNLFEQKNFQNGGDAAAENRHLKCAVQSTGLRSQLKSKIQIGIVKIHKYALHDREKKNEK